MKLLLIGPPGSGKGTQGQLLADRFGLVHIAAGDRLRDEVEKGSRIGGAVAGYLNRGELVPDDIITELLMPVVVDALAHNGYVLDGFPRSVGQAVVARKLAEEIGATPDAVVYLDAEPDELVRRILDRAKVEDRSDDTEAVIKNRLAVFDGVTRPLIEFYRSRGLLYVIDANRSEREVEEQILAAIGHLAPDVR
jgi:adenylate kinase